MSKLFVVPTPIGNLEDITLRALRILREEVDLILAEDTRKTGILLKHYDISKPMASFHQHNEHKVLAQFVRRLAGGERMALVSDAGTPAISDPGFLLVRECVRSGIEVECLPGATAFVPALVNSGLSADRFVFEGFLPHKKGRQKRLTKLSVLPYTVILYESPHRLVRTLDELAKSFGPERQASVSRELTKMFEQTLRGTLSELAEHFGKQEVKGELVIVIEGSDRRREPDEEEKE
jgi:16S rRNA (cytidine1402-2'-O)-methyltransferase